MLLLNKILIVDRTNLRCADDLARISPGGDTGTLL